MKEGVNEFCTFFGESYIDLTFLGCGNRTEKCIAEALSEMHVLTTAAYVLHIVTNYSTLSKLTYLAL